MYGTLRILKILHTVITLQYSTATVPVCKLYCTGYFVGTEQKSYYVLPLLHTVPYIEGTGFLWRRVGMKDFSLECILVNTQGPLSSG
jgi:hypothetical protein